MIPREFEERMELLLGEGEAKKLISALGEDNVRAFRVNEKKIKINEFLSYGLIDAEPVPYAEDGFYTNEERPGRGAAHHAGMIYMQDPSAMATMHALKLRRGARVLDCCASPGGKSTQISSYIGGEGILVSNEYVAKRCRTLRGNIERLGCENTVLLNLDTKYLAEEYPGFFDLVVCDAPCSGEGMFRKNDVAISEWSLDNVQRCAERQTEILENVCQCVANGGCLLYSTCTFSLEENEMNVDAFLSRHPEFSLCGVEEKLREHTSDGICFDGCLHDMRMTRRFYPHISRGEGQFIALMRREGEPWDISDRADRTDDEIYRRNKVGLRIAEDFLKENLTQIPQGYTLVEYNGSMFLKPPIRLPRFGVFSAGVCVGEIKGNRLLPHHHLFSSLGGLFKSKLMLDASDTRVSAYLSGNEITMTENEKFDGYGVLCVNGAPLGGVKASGGVCKNHYPKGLRQ